MLDPSNATTSSGFTAPVVEDAIVVVTAEVAATAAVFVVRVIPIAEEWIGLDQVLPNLFHPMVYHRLG